MYAVVDWQLSLSTAYTTETLNHVYALVDWQTDNQSSWFSDTVDMHAEMSNSWNTTPRMDQFWGLSWILEVRSLEEVLFFQVLGLKTTTKKEPRGGGGFFQFDWQEICCDDAMRWDLLWLWDCAHECMIPCLIWNSRCTQDVAHNSCRVCTYAQIYIYMYDIYMFTHIDMYIYVDVLIHIYI